MGKTRGRVKKVSAFNNWGKRIARDPLFIYVLTGLVGGCITIWMFTRSSSENVDTGGFLFTVWALLLAVTIYRISAKDGEKTLAGLAKAEDLLTEAHVLAEQSQRDAKQLLAKVDGLAKQLEELTRSQQFHGQYENDRGVPGGRMVAKTGDNYVVSLYGRPKFLLTKLSPYSVGDSSQDLALKQPPRFTGH